MESCCSTKWFRENNGARAVESGEVKDTKFSHDRGFFDQGFELAITTATPDATVVYTTDGSEPTLENGRLGNTLFIARTTVVRARAFKEGMTPTNVDTQTYILPPSCPKTQTNSRLARRAVSIVIDLWRAPVLGRVGGDVGDSGSPSCAKTRPI